MKVKDIAAWIEEKAPLQLQESYDNAGLQVGDPEAEVSRVLTTLDVTEESVRLAVGIGANLIVSHHPLLFRGTKQINPRRDYISRVIMAAIRHNIAIYSAHTNLDNAKGGVNYKIGEVLGLRQIRPLARLSEQQTAGLAPAFVSGCGSGIVGELQDALSLPEFVTLLKDKLHIEALQGNAADVDPEKKITKVALCGGAGDDFIADAVRVGADAYLTGEVSYHAYFGHPEMLILCGGHFETEQFTSRLLADMIREKYPDLAVEVAAKSSPLVTW